MSEPRKHHFLPQFYLQHFVEAGRLARLDKGSCQEVVASPTNLAAIRDFHRLDDESFGDQFKLEKKLGEIDGQLSRAVDSVLENGITDEESHVRLVEFVSLMRMRVPAMRDWIEESLRTVVRSTGNLLERHGELPARSNELENAINFDNLALIRQIFRG